VKKIKHPKMTSKLSKESSNIEFERAFQKDKEKDFDETIYFFRHLDKKYAIHMSFENNMKNTTN
jgi:hypothetical protein